MAGGSRDPWYIEHFSQEAAEARYIIQHTTDPLLALRALGIGAREIDRVTHVCVVELREQGVTWAEIADALGVTRQAAQRRFRRNHETEEEQ